MPLPSREPTDLTDDALTDRVRILQRAGGHRYSIDDVVTAWVAIRAAGGAQSCLDLGCGIGSVLLMLVDRVPELRAVGIEAQAESYALAERNVERNRLGRRVRVQFGDLRDRALLDRILETEVAFGRPPGFDVVTGTPPYKPVGSASPSPDPQRAHARIELRGGVEAYLSAGAHVLAPHGVLVICAESELAPRVEAGALSAALRCIHQLDVIPMQDRKRRLFSVYCFVPEAAEDGGDAVLARLGGLAWETLVLRDAQGARTEAARELRAFFGLQIDPAEPASPPLRAREQGRAALRSRLR